MIYVRMNLKNKLPCLVDEDEFRSSSIRKRERKRNVKLLLINSASVLCSPCTEVQGVSPHFLKINKCFLCWIRIAYINIFLLRHKLAYPKRASVANDEIRVVRSSSQTESERCLFLVLPWLWCTVVTPFFIHKIWKPIDIINLWFIFDK